MLLRLRQRRGRRHDERRGRRGRARDRQHAHAAHARLLLVRHGRRRRTRGRGIRPRASRSSVHLGVIAVLIAVGVVVVGAVRAARASELGDRPATTDGCRAARRGPSASATSLTVWGDVRLLLIGVIMLGMSFAEGSAQRLARARRRRRPRLRRRPSAPLIFRVFTVAMTTGPRARRSRCSTGSAASRCCACMAATGVVGLSLFIFGTEIVDAHRRHRRSGASAPRWASPSACPPRPTYPTALGGRARERRGDHRLLRVPRRPAVPRLPRRALRHPERAARDPRASWCSPASRRPRRATQPSRAAARGLTRRAAAPRLARLAADASASSGDPLAVHSYGASRHRPLLRRLRGTALAPTCRSRRDC